MPYDMGFSTLSKTVVFIGLTQFLSEFITSYVKNGMSNNGGSQVIQ